MLELDEVGVDVVEEDEDDDEGGGVVDVVEELEDEEVRLVVPWKLPIVIVTVEPFFCAEPPLGVWPTTIPARSGLVTGRVARTTVKPADCSALTAPATGSLITGGTVTVAGAEATTIVTVDPLAAVAPAPGLWLITLPAVTVLEVRVWVLRWKPAPLSCALAVASVSPITEGTFVCGVPEDTNSVTGVPGGTERAAPGLVPVAWPALKRLEGCTLTWVTFSPARFSCLVAVALALALDRVGR